jgi:DNA primase
LASEIGDPEGVALPAGDREILTRQIRDSVDIVDVIGSYVALRRAGASFKGLCPFHQEKSPSFMVSSVKQSFKCFGCGAGGDVFTFIQLREKVEFVEARRMLAERAGISLEREQPASSRGGPSKTDMIRANDWALKIFRRNYTAAGGQVARDYVAGRGISAESVEAFGLGWAVDSFDSLIRAAGTAKVDVKLLAAAGLVREKAAGGWYDTFRNRLMFPIRDAAGRVIGFGGRTLGTDPAKYLNTPATLIFDKSTHLFGLDRARTRMGEVGRAVIVEGYTDCIMAHQHGFTEAVATLGTAMTDQHAALLRRYTDRVILLFDSDDAGQKAADRALSVSLTGGLDVLLARVPQGKDPCDYLLSAGSSAFEDVLKEACPALEFRWLRVAKEYEGSATGPGRRRAIEAYFQQLSDWMSHGALDSIQLGLLVNQLSKVLSLPPGDVHQQLARGARVVAKGAAPSRDRQLQSPPSNSEQESLRQILEVLLNEPSCYADVADVLDPSAIEDPALAAVAKALISIFDSAGPDGFRLNDLIGKLELPSFAALVTDLQIRGEHRGGYEQAIQGAVECLRSSRRARQTVQLGEEIRQERQQAVQGATPQGEDERLRAINAKVMDTSLDRPMRMPANRRKKFLT